MIGWNWSFIKHNLSDFPGIMSSGCDGGRTSCYYTSPRIVHIGTSSLQLHRLLHTHGEGTDRRTLRKKQVLVSRSFLDQELCYFDTTNPGGKRVFWAHVVAHVQGPGYGTCSRPRTWDKFGIQFRLSLAIYLEHWSKFFLFNQQSISRLLYSSCVYQRFNVLGFPNTV